MLTLKLMHAEETVLYDVLHKQRVKLYWHIWEKLPDDVREDLNERAAIKLDGTECSEEEADALALYDLIGSHECPRPLKSMSTAGRYRVVLHIETRMALLISTRTEETT